MHRRSYCALYGLTCWLAGSWLRDELKLYSTSQLSFLQCPLCRSALAEEAKGALWQALQAGRLQVPADSTSVPASAPLSIFFYLALLFCEQRSHNFHFVAQDVDAITLRRLPRRWLL